MNTNIKISLTDEQRNILYQRMTGKNVKRMISRAEVNQLVHEYIEMLLTKGYPTFRVAGNPTLVEDEDGGWDMGFNPHYAEIELSPEPTDLADDEYSMIVKQNRLLLRRVNLLQARLDKVGGTK
jgi:hypothetical protein